MGALVCSFQTIGKTQPTLPYNHQLIWNSCDYCNSSCNRLPSPWPNSSPLPRGAGQAVLFRGGWHSIYSTHGDFNINLEKPYATDFHSLLASFDLKRLTTTSMHKSGNQLDLIYTHDCTADNFLVKHHISLQFMQFNLHYILLPGCNQPPYRLLLDETYTTLPFSLTSFLCNILLFSHLHISHLWMWTLLLTRYALP